ncbi:SCP160 protein [Wolfiporia cocos MD-104 SS10]|uniref:SCP160 protein n=1 Tax=Wolfiporia cocos (strain MD-104) TaxID=742152 RepID=A0A2H3JNM7_WOLCO|nr:SCP160 protein [Wolfiporia cocos MD-104 SS10]
MSLTAADYQKSHGLDGTQESASPPPDSLPVDAAPTELDSPEQFPTLAPSTQGATQGANWPAAGPRIKAAVAKQPVFADSFMLSSSEMAATGMDGKPTTAGEVIKQVSAQFKVKIDASTNQKLRQTTFLFKADSQKDLDKAKRSLLAQLSPSATITLNAPASTIPSIIGPKGATLKKVRDQTNVRIDIPRRDLNGNGATQSGAATPQANDDEEDEPTVPITITGPQPLALEAQALLNEIIATKRRYSTQRVRDIPAHVLPFLVPRYSQFIAAADNGEVSLTLNRELREIAVSGERTAVGRAADAIRSAMGYFSNELTSVRLTLPKRQHRLLIGKNADDIVAKGKCSVIVPAFDESSDEITVWGKNPDLGAGLAAVMEKANSAYIHEFPLPGPISLSRQLLTYFTRIDYPKTLSAETGVSVFTPPESAANKASVLNVDIIGEKSSVDAAVSQLSALIGKLIGATKEVQIDWLVHPILIHGNKNAKKIKSFHENHNVLVFFPPESAEQSSVLLVYDPTTPNASPSPGEKAKDLEDVEKELLKMARDAADVKTQTLTVEKKWHDAVVGNGGTTLNAIIGEDRTLSIKVGAEAWDATTEDIILVRGASADVERAVKEIQQIVERAKNDEIINSYAVEFDISREYVGRIVGAQGSGVNKLRDSLGVRIDFSDEQDDKEQFVTAGKKKKAVPHQKSHVKIVGRKENVEEAKKRILAQVERLADETQEVLKIPHEYHAGLIGQSGKYVIRLEEKYGVMITFPRGASENGEGRGREPLKPDEVLIKGGRKGVAGAKSELLDAVEFEKENNKVLKFTVPSRAVARILGKSGTSINEIKDATGAQIDVDRAPDDQVANITVRGTKDAIAEAKEAILKIADQVGEETTDSLQIESRFHRTIIGAGGQGLKELINRCGGPTDSKAQAGLVRFPRQGEPSDEVRLRGEPKVVAKIKEELEKTVAALRDRVVLAVDIPAAQHRGMIGRGGQHLNDLQNRHGVQVQFPGSRSYYQVDEPENAAELDDADPANIVKVSGPRAACERAVEDLKSQIRPPAADPVTATLTVPLKYHHAVTQQGNLFRQLRSAGVQVEQSVFPQKPAVPPHPVIQADASEARIDDIDTNAAPEVQWQVVSNYQDAEEGDSEWTFRARDQAGLDRALSLTKEAIEHAEEMSHVGFLTLPNRLSFPRIVGAKGANVARLRNESGADITVSREDNTVTIVGTETAIETAKAAILKIVSGNSRPRGRRDD